MIDKITFDDLFPRASYGAEPIEGIFLAGRLHPCFVCGRITGWVSLSFEAHVCSAVCDDLSWTRFWKADAEAGPWWESKS